jgi:hypothetical protein
MMSRFVPASATFQTAVADRRSYRAWKLLIDIDGDGALEDITSYIANNNVSGGGKNDGTSKQYQVVLRNGDKTFYEGQFSGAIAAIEVQVGSSSEYIRIFTGFVSIEGASRTKKNQQDDTISLTLVDDVKKSAMKTKASPAAYVGFAVCNPSSPSTSLFHTLIYQLGYVAADLDVGTITDTVPVLTVDGSRTVWQELQDLAACWNGWLSIRYDGKVLFRSPFESGYAAPTSEWTFDENNLHNWSAKKNDKTCTRATMEFDIYESLGECVVYKNTEGMDESTGLIDIEIAPGAYWPGSASGSKAQLNYKNPDTGEKIDFAASIATPTIGPPGSGCDIESYDGLPTIISFNGSTADTMQNGNSSEIILKNNTSSTIHLWKIQVQGVAYRIISKNTVRDEDNTLDEYEHIEKKIPGNFAHDADQAHTVCNWHVEYGKTPRKTYDIEVDWIPQIQEGALVRFDPPGETTDIYATVETFHHPAANGPMPKQKTVLSIVEYAAITPTGSAKQIVETSGSSIGAYVKEVSAAANSTTKDLIAKWPMKNVPMIPNGSTPDYLSDFSASVGNWKRCVDEGIVSIWDLVGGALTDGSGGGHTLTAIGSPAYVSDAGGEWYDLDAVDDYLRATGTDFRNLQFTASMKIQTSGMGAGMISCGLMSITYYWVLKLSNDGTQIYLRLWNGSSLVTILETAGASLFDGLKHRIGVTYDGVNVRFYRDGVKTSTVPASFTGYYATGYLIIGYDYNSATFSRYDGKIGNIRMSSRALSDREMAALHSADSADISVSGGRLIVPKFAGGCYLPSEWSLANKIIAAQLELSQDDNLNIEYQTGGAWGGTRTLSVDLGDSAISIYGTGTTTGVKIFCDVNGFSLAVLYVGDGAYLARSAIDVSGHSVNGRILGAVPAKGMTGTALFFNGGKGSITILNADLPDMSGKFSFAFFVEGRVRTVVSRLVTYGPVAPYYGIGCGLNANGIPTMAISPDGSGFITLAADEAIIDDSLVVYKYEPGIAMCITVNGIVRAVRTDSVPTEVHTSVSDLYIGQMSAGAGTFYGWIDCIEFYSKYTSDKEDKYLYQNPGGNLANLSALEGVVSIPTHTPHYLGRALYASPPTANSTDDTCTLYSTTAGERGIYKWSAQGTWVKQTTPTTEMITAAWADICWIVNEVTDYGEATAYTGSGVNFIDVLGANLAFINKLFAQYIKIQTGGSIRGGNRYDESGAVVDGTVPGFFISAGGACKVAGIEFEGSQSGGVQWSGGQQIGTELNIAGMGIPVLCALNATDIAFVDYTNRDLRCYRFNGTGWTMVGNELNIAGMGIPALCALNATDIAFVDYTNKDLRCYRFDGTDWTMVGNELNIAGVGNPAMCALNATDIAFIDGGNDDLRLYRFDGTDWTMVGNELNIAGAYYSAMCALNGTDIAFIDGGNDDLRLYRFDGTDWTMVGNELNIAGVGNPAICALNGTDVAFIDSTNDQLRIYRRASLDWAQVAVAGSPAIGGGNPALGALNGTDIAFIDDGNCDLRVYRFSFSLSKPWRYPFTS